MSSFYRYLDHDCIDTTFGRLIMSAKNLFNSKDLVDFYKNYISFEQFQRLRNLPHEYYHSSQQLMWVNNFFL